MFVPYVWKTPSHKAAFIIRFYYSIVVCCCREYLLLALCNIAEKEGSSYDFDLYNVFHKLQFITNRASIHWSISSESDLVTRNGFGLFIRDLSLYQKDGVLKYERLLYIECRSDVFHSILVVYRRFFIRWQSVILLKSCPVAFSTGDFVISPEISDKGSIFLIRGQVSLDSSQVEQAKFILSALCCL